MVPGGSLVRKNTAWVWNSGGQLFILLARFVAGLIGLQVLLRPRAGQLDCAAAVRQAPKTMPIPASSTVAALAIRRCIPASRRLRAHGPVRMIGKVSWRGIRPPTDARAPSAGHYGPQGIPRVN